MMEEKAGVAVEFQQTLNKGFEKNQHACIEERVFVVSYSTARPYLKLAGQTQNQNSSKLCQF